MTRTPDDASPQLMLAPTTNFSPDISDPVPVESPVVRSNQPVLNPSYDSHSFPITVLKLLTAYKDDLMPPALDEWIICGSQLFLA
jgi:hypothetical protein